MKKPFLILKQEIVIDHKATGAMVRKYREALGFTQKQIATQLGMSYETIISDLESGKRIWSPVKMRWIVDGFAALLRKK